VGVEPLLGVLVAREDVEVVSIDLNVSADGQVSRCDDLVVLVDILVLAALEESALDDAGVLLGWLVNRNGVVRHEERDDEAAVDVLRHACVDAGCETEDLSLVINCLKEVLLGLLRDQTVDVAKGIDFITKAVVRRDLALGVLTRLRVLNLADLEVLT